MMNNRKVSLVLLIFISLLAGCGGTGGKDSTTKAKVFRFNLGLTMGNEFNEAVDKMVYARHRYIRSGDSRTYPNKISVVTEWQPRFIFDDEKELGIVAVESRIHMTAKLRPGQASSIRGESTYNATMRAENRVKYAAIQDWQPGPMTTQAKNYFRDIADDLMQEIKKPY